MNVNSALRQRIAIKYVMQGLKKEEIQGDIKTRMKIAGVVDDLLHHRHMYNDTRKLDRQKVKNKLEYSYE
ncbi:AAA ATPase [Thermoanaerobacterium aotearoense SCUT27]|uniref:AAA ATPase n=2 Tax=Thermoanaerobacterium TaxID=28895 RepID=W9E7L9_9THEO|nr:AAA ATPase [Thermoanaerobacterium saccharolyticum JW/SL-YS485]ETO37447.1 AAA ATPase [Thermoanaerobacterium aotearoense SCUT27]